jgi:hypothetical protein
VQKYVYSFFIYFFKNLKKYFEFIKKIVVKNWYLSRKSFLFFIVVLLINHQHSYPCILHGIEHSEIIEETTPYMYSATSMHLNGKLIGVKICACYHSKKFPRARFSQGLISLHYTSVDEFRIRLICGVATSNSRFVQIKLRKIPSIIHPNSAIPMSQLPTQERISFSSPNSPCVDQSNWISPV